MGCLLTAQFYSPATIIVVDMDENRLAMAKEMGATHTVNPNKEDAVAKILEITGGRGVDCAMEAVGYPATWDVCQKVVKEGGHVANVGVHGKSVEFDLAKLWIKNITVTTGLVNANTTGMLLAIKRKERALRKLESMAADLARKTAPRCERNIKV